MYLLMVDIGADGIDYPLAVFETEEDAEAAGKRLREAYDETDPAFSQWCSRKVGPRPKLIGYPYYEVYEVSTGIEDEFLKGR